MPCVACGPRVDGCPASSAGLKRCKMCVLQVCRIAINICKALAFLQVGFGFRLGN